MDVRLEIPSDAAPIRAVLEASFPTATEAELVDELRRAGDVVFSLAAVDGVRIVGCVVFSEMVAPFPALALGPVAVRPERQRRGVGSLLIRDGLARCEVGGWAAVFVLGNPAYYGRFGFRADRASGLESPYIGPHFIALALGRGEWPANSGELGYARAFAALG
jgi:putative acetyltransferase